MWAAALRLPGVFTDHAVVQHSRRLAVWGWAEPGRKVVVDFRGASARTVADEAGRFEAAIDAGPPGGPFDLFVRSNGQTQVVRDVLVGEVWLGAGQSNMAMALDRTEGSAADIAGARDPGLRLFTVPRTPASCPVADVSGGWATCTPESAAAFSAVAFHFGKHLREHLGVPIGLICAAWGSTGAEAWTRREDLLSQAELAYLVDPPVPHEDPGPAPATAAWMDEGLEANDWGEMVCPQPWEHAGLYIDGAVWFRKELDIPAALAGRPAELSLGVADDFDRTFFNGQLIGATGLETPDPWYVHRRYRVPGEWVKAGRNVVAVRVFDRWGCGGLTGPKDEMYLGPAEGNDGPRISLAGRWRYKVELALPPRAPAAVPAASLYNGMIHPFVRCPLAGAIWYQGETNMVRAWEYRTLFPAMIRGWRAAWNEDLPFLFVVLAGWHEPPDEPAESGLAELREAQLSALRLTRTAAASAVDLGDVQDIHPTRKKEVGIRLARAALATCYGRNLEFRGPTLRRVSLAAGVAELTFDHADGLHARGGRPVGFAVAGDDGRYCWAEARIDGPTVTLTSARVPAIRSVRYNWADNPAGNLYNAAGLPMLPFRTDDRPYTTLWPAHTGGEEGPAAEARSRGRDSRTATDRLNRTKEDRTW